MELVTRSMTRRPEKEGRNENSGKRHCPERKMSSDCFELAGKMRKSWPSPLVFFHPVRGLMTRELPIFAHLTVMA